MLYAVYGAACEGYLDGQLKPYVACSMLYAVCYAVGCIRIPNINHRLMNWGSVSTDGMLSSSSTSTSAVNFWFQVEMRRIRAKMCRRHPLTAQTVLVVGAIGSLHYNAQREYGSGNNSIKFQSSFK